MGLDNWIEFWKDDGKADAPANAKLDALKKPETNSEKPTPDPRHPTQDPFFQGGTNLNK